jgi:hypothetical protein
MPVTRSPPGRSMPATLHRRVALPPAILYP